MSKPALERSRRVHRIGVLGALTIVATMSVGCFCHPWPFVLYDAGAAGMAWEDTNCNGVRDGGESSLAGVCVWASVNAGKPTPSPEECADEQFQTDISGLYGGYFFAGASCNDVYIFAQAPEGFCPTTDTVVNGCVGEFGFAPIGLCQCRPAMMPEQSSVQQ